MVSQPPRWIETRLDRLAHLRSDRGASSRSPRCSACRPPSPGPRYWLTTSVTNLLWGPITFVLFGATIWGAIVLYAYVRRRADLPGPGPRRAPAALRDQAWILSYQVLSTVVIFGVAWARARGLAVRPPGHDRRRPRQRARALASRCCSRCCRRPPSRGSSPIRSPRRADGATRGARRPGLHNRLAVLRAERGLSRQELADALGRELPDDRLPRARRVQPEPRPRPARRRVLRPAGRGGVQPDSRSRRCPRSSTAELAPDGDPRRTAVPARARRASARAAPPVVDRVVDLGRRPAPATPPGRAGAPRRPPLATPRPAADGLRSARRSRGSRPWSPSRTRPRGRRGPTAGPSANSAANTSTRSGSNWTPAWRRSSSIAASCEIAARYGRPAIIASYASTMDTMRAPIGMSAAGQPVRVAAAVVPLVVVEHDRRGVAQRARLLEHDLADLRDAR